MGKTRSNRAMVYAQRILFAARVGDLRLVQRSGKHLLKSKSGEMLQVSDQKGNAAIHYAALHGDKDMCRYITESLLVEVDFRSNSGKTPLCYAAHGGNLDTIEYLLSQSADVNATDAHRLTPLHHAVLGDKDMVIQLLLLRGARVGAPSSVGTPLMFATFQGSLSCMKALLSRQAQLDKAGCEDLSPLVIAIMRPIWSKLNLDPVYTLIESGAKVNERQILGLASYSLTLVKYLLRHGADPAKDDMFGRMPELVAATKNRRKVVKALVSERDFHITPIAETVERIFDRVNNNVYRLEWREAFELKLRTLMPRIGKALSRKDYLAALILATYGYLEDDRRVFRHIMHDCFVQFAAAVEALEIRSHSMLPHQFFVVGDLDLDEQVVYRIP